MTSVYSPHERSLAERNGSGEHRRASVSVVIPLKRLNEYVRQSLEHLARQTYTGFDVYVITDEPQTCDTVGLRVTFLSSGPVPPNIKRHMAAERSRADVVALLDDDAYPAPGWLDAALRHFDDPSVAAVGGPGVTPPEDPPSQQASGAVYASPLVSAGYVYRYIPASARDVDDYPSCNLMVRRETFLRHIGECLRYWPGEDTKLCLLITEDTGHKIIYEPEAIVYHHRRPLFWGHFRQVWNYAVHRGFFAKRYPATSLRPQYFVPTAFAAANVAAVAAMTHSSGRKLVAGAAALYVLAVVAAVAAGAKHHRANPMLVALGIYLTHMTYGIGIAVGLTRPELDH